jgi:hypothetical protein
MNKNTAGALLVLMIAAAGFTWDKPAAVVFAGVTCALTFLAAEFADCMWTHIGARAAFCLAVGSWITVALGALSLTF